MRVGWLSGVSVCLGNMLLLCAQNQNPASSPASFSRDIAPLLERSCLTCHGPAQPMSQLDLSTRDAALKGGQKAGPAIVPGDSAKSPLYRRVTGQDQPAMPLGAKLTSSEIKTIQEWIDSGAAWDGALSARAAATAPPSASSRRLAPETPTA